MRRKKQNEYVSVFMDSILGTLVYFYIIQEAREIFTFSERRKSSSGMQLSTTDQ